MSNDCKTVGEWIGWSILLPFRTAVHILYFICSGVALLCTIPATPLWRILEDEDGFFKNNTTASVAREFKEQSLEGKIGIIASLPLSLPFFGLAVLLMRCADKLEQALV